MRNTIDINSVRQIFIITILFEVGKFFGGACTRGEDVFDAVVEAVWRPNHVEECEYGDVLADRATVPGHGFGEDVEKLVCPHVVVVDAVDELVKEEADAVDKFDSGKAF